MYTFSSWKLCRYEKDDFDLLMICNYNNSSYKEEIVNNLSFILIALLILCCGCIQKIDSNHSLSSLVEAERSFVETSRAKGIRDAFLSYLADDAIVFRPRPVKAKPLYAERQQIPGSLIWYPVYADVSLAGDLGYTTGPFEYRSKMENQQADGCGFYVSIWKKQANDTWRVMIDAGIDCPCPNTTGSEIIIKKQPHRFVSKTNADRDSEAEKSKLLEHDSKFSGQVASGGIVNAYQDTIAWVSSLLLEKKMFAIRLRISR
jgi:ketosteroid isomerase-like protein